MAVFFSFMAYGLWGFIALPEPWRWLAFIAAFLVGGTSSMIVFKRLASEEQRKNDLEARLHND
ncbi:hypothetical protein [Erythrobacter rubeus]|uniref:YiaAB two helix domain-containing protein n=1 Tax=Erythrobacter rubeus TaxID=2760803 RepID=A0ABR8KRW1_9SPHN|nr:hypothetical protein [Erythrobacter rubeus]MBD2842075.1 hypothetical protein [Erythrobacter rubeus]